jgi:hypothetical protein
MAQIAWSTILFLAHALAKIAAEDDSMVAAEAGSMTAAEIDSMVAAEVDSTSAAEVRWFHDCC